MNTGKAAGHARRAAMTAIVVYSTVLAGCSNAPDPAATSAVGPGRADHYSIAADATLTVAAPGVLGNDIVSDTTTAALVDKPRWGRLSLAADGSFVYEPKYKFAGNDTFSYQLLDGDNKSAPVTVSIGFPNVIVMVIDDIGMGYIGAYSDRAPVATPNLDTLAASGMLFTRAHSPAAVCSPSRYSIMTGNHPYRGQQSAGVWGSYHPETMIVPGQQTLGDIFSMAGYQTAFVGKMHNGAAFQRRDGDGYTRNPEEVDFAQPFDRGPTQFGFDYSFVLPGGLSGPPYAYFENDRLVRYTAASGLYEPFASDADARQHLRTDLDAWGAAPGGGRIGGAGAAMDNYDSRKSGAILTRQALAFIDRAVAANTTPDYPQPFFLYFAPPQMHTPYTPPEYFNPAHSDDDRPADSGEPVAGISQRTENLDIIREIDLMTGALIDKLAEHNQLADTLIVFTSDNGVITAPNERDIVAQGTDRGVPLRGFKGEIFEAGHRVPLLARWGDGTRNGSRIAPGSRSGERIGLHDFAATFYSLLGQQRPLDQANDSKSILPELLGTRPADRPLRDHLIVQGSPASAADNAFRIDRAFYQRDSAGDWWKLVAVSSLNDPLADIEWRDFYNVTADPGEANNRRNDSTVAEWQATMRERYLDLVARRNTIDSFR